MEEDDEGFRYLVIAEGRWKKCGICEKACSVFNQNVLRLPRKAYAAKNKDQKILQQGSSGGIFSLLTEQVSEEGEAYERPVL